MLSIGEFARLGGVSVRTLRYYEEVALLSPAAVDMATGYRSYSARQFARLHRIVALKELGFTLGQIRPVVDGLRVDELRGMLVLKRAELEERVRADGGRLGLVEQRLRFIEREDEMDGEIMLKEVPPLRIAAVAVDRPGVTFDNMLGHLAESFGTLAESLESAGIADHGPLFSYYVLRADAFLIPHLAVEIRDRVIDGEGVHTTTLPAEQMACTVVEYPSLPSHDLVGPTYAALARWAEDRGYDAKGPGRDLMLGGDDGRIVMEHQLPVEKAG
jgi:DNA-binding transcriptional MerR regulator